MKLSNRNFQIAFYAATTAAFFVMGANAWVAVTKGVQAIPFKNTAGSLSFAVFYFLIVLPAYIRWKHTKKAGD